MRIRRRLVGRKHQGESMLKCYQRPGTNRERASLLPLVVVVALIVGARAWHALGKQPAPANHNIYFVTPICGSQATTLPPLAHEPEVNSEVSSIDLLSHLDGAPFMGSGEVRYRQFGFLVEAVHLPVSTNVIGTSPTTCSPP
jgi:hypothetical protein